MKNGTAYLAASCMDASFTSLGYFLFTSDTSLTNWQYKGVSFNLSTLKSKNPGLPSSWQFLTEFDWAARSDNSLVAVVTPAAIVSGNEQQFGCLAVNFDLSAGFGTIVATLTDVDSPPSGPNENLGPNACTYEPTSNTGMLIVRRLMLTGHNYFVVSLIKSGIMP